jgi:hypothetical protein
VSTDNAARAEDAFSLSFPRSVAALGNSLFPYKNAIENLLCYGGDAVKTHMELAGFYPDTENFVDQPSEDNVGYTKRRAIVNDGEPFEIIIPILCDFLQTPEAFPPKKSVKIRLVRSPPRFYMMTNAASAQHNFEVLFDDMLLYCNYIETKPSIREACLARHKKSPLRMSMKKCIMKNFDIPAGLPGKQIVVHEKDAPKLFIVVLTRSDVFQVRIFFSS